MVLRLEYFLALHSTTKSQVKIVKKIFQLYFDEKSEVTRIKNGKLIVYVVPILSSMII